MGWFGNWMEKLYVDAVERNATKKPGKLVWSSYVFALNTYTTDVLANANRASDPPTEEDKERVAASALRLFNKAKQALDDNASAEDICDVITTSGIKFTDHAGSTMMGAEGVATVINRVRAGSL